MRTIVTFLVSIVAITAQNGEAGGPTVHLGPEAIKLASALAHPGAAPCLNRLSQVSHQMTSVSMLRNSSGNDVFILRLRSNPSTVVPVPRDGGVMFEVKYGENSIKNVKCDVSGFLSK